ncbi:unnamed protein product, partial [marine sediment metagenome]
LNWHNPRDHLIDNGHITCYYTELDNMKIYEHIEVNYLRFNHITFQ